MKSLPVDDNGRAMYDRCRELGTKNYTGVDSTTGVDISFDVDVKEFAIVPTVACAAAAYTVTGTIAGYTDAMECIGERGWPIAVKAETQVCTIKAVAGTIDFAVVIVR